MSNVLNRTTLQYLESVNTPDYPETEWVINPDLSGVVGVSPGYWVLETIPERPYQPYVAEVLAVPEVPEVLDTDGVTVLVAYSPAIPYSPEIPELMYLPERNIIRPMTPIEQAAKDALYKPTENPNRLLSGIPAFFDASRNIIRSVNEKETIFSTRTTGSKNFYLNTDSLVASNVKGWHTDTPIVIVAVSATIQLPTSFDVILELKNNSNNAVLTSLVIPAGQLVSLINTSLKLPVGSEVSCYLSSASLVANPSVRVSYSATN